MNRNQVDFEITTRAGRAIALVEVRNIPRLAASGAIELRKGLFEEDLAPLSPAYFLILSQENSFLWEPEQARVADAEPAVVFPMREVLQEYLGDQLIDRHLRGAELEIVVLQWLNDLTRGRESLPSEVTGLSRFVAKLRDGEVHAGVAL